MTMTDVVSLPEPLNIAAEAERITSRLIDALERGGQTTVVGGEQLVIKVLDVIEDQLDDLEWVLAGSPDN